MMRMKRISTKKCIWTSLPVFILILLAGLVIGSAADNTVTGFEWLDRLFYDINAGTTVLDEVRNTFLLSLIFLLAAFLFGLFAVGQPFLYLLIFCLGNCIGSCTAAMYRIYGKSAVLLLLMTLIPKASGLFVTVILSVKASLKSSASLFCAFLYGDLHDCNGSGLKLFCIRYTVLILLSLAFSAVVGFLDYLYLAVCRS